jgi:hypothetical protein
MKTLTAICLTTCLLSAPARADSPLPGKLQAYSDKAADRPPREAAQGWIDLWTAWQQNHGTTSFDDLLKVLPAPALWPDLITLLDQPSAAAATPLQREQKFFTATLANSEQKQWDALFAIGRDVAPSATPSLIGQIFGSTSTPARPPMNIQSLQRTATALAPLTDDPALFQKGVEFLLQLAKSRLGVDISLRVLQSAPSPSPDGQPNPKNHPGSGLTG